GIWHHVVVIRNNTTIRLYVDGEIIKELFGDALNGDSVYYLSIGASFIDGFYWHGIIDEVRIYKKAIY
nr:hypothetical protein [Candidatus Aenigmarchaeota archaeon]